MRRRVDALTRRCIDTSTRWRVDVLMRRCVEAWTRRCVDVSARRGFDANTRRPETPVRIRVKPLLWACSFPLPEHTETEVEMKNK